MKGIYCLKPMKDRILSGLALWLIKRGVTADHLTFTGLILGIAATYLVYSGTFQIGILFIIFSVFADLLDGTLARLSGSDSLTGKLFDAACDRIVEIGWVGSLVFQHWLPWWGWLLPLGSVGLLLARYLAFQKRIDTSFVPVTRFERVTAVIGVIIVPWRWLSGTFYLLVTVGTAVSIMMIVWAIHRRKHIGDMVYQPISR